MPRTDRNHIAYRGLLQSADGIITRVFEADGHSISFETAFRLDDPLMDRLKNQPEHLVFSERSRIARLGIQIRCEPPNGGNLQGDTVFLNLVASPVITGYPGLDQLRRFFAPGLPIGRLAFCDPEALLTSDEVLQAIERSELKLPASTTISSEGNILIAPHRVVCVLREPLGEDLLERILLREDGREILSRHQVRRTVPSLAIPPGEGIVTTCSMFLNEHYVVLDSGFTLGSHLPATILDPIKTRGIRIYLEIVNGSGHPIVNPLISARIYRASKTRPRGRVRVAGTAEAPFSYNRMRQLEKRFAQAGPSTCHFLVKPAAVLPAGTDDPEKARIFLNGPDQPCEVSRAICAQARRDFSCRSRCSHVYATASTGDGLDGRRFDLALKYFPNLLEHRDIINHACAGRIDSLYFYEASCEHGPFLSQFDHNRLQEYDAFGISVYWVSGLNHRLMVHTMRDGMGYFVVPERLSDFHKSMLFAFYGSNRELSDPGVKRLARLMEALVDFWGKKIGIVTGGGSGVMEHANRLAREMGILSGANFLDITDQKLVTDVDFCQVFQDKCRHSRQKWFEVASFPIFNVGGLGSLEELGITLCNMKLAILEPVPVILFDAEGEGEFWKNTVLQIREMIRRGRAPQWVEDNLVITGDPGVVIDAYRTRLQLL